MAKRSKYSGLQSVAYSQRKRRGLLVKFFNFLLILLSLTSTVTLVVALCAPHISPESSTLCSIVALAAPYNYVCCLLLLLMWVVRWRRWALVMLVPVVWGSFYVGRFVQVDFMIDREVGGKNDLRIMTYNTHSMGRMSSNNPTVLDSILQKSYEQNADIICFQEYNLYDSVGLRKFDSVLCDYPFKAYSIEAECKKLTQKHRGFLTISKYKILHSKYYNLTKGINTGFLVSEILVGSDTVKIVNVHLQTTGIGTLNKDGGVRTMVSDSGVMDVGGKMFDHLNANFKLRAPQAQRLRSVVDSLGSGVIVAGDFNSIPISYCYNTIIGDNLTDAFVEGGKGYGYTYRELLGVLRIDYVLFDDLRWRCVEYNSPDWQYSDHNPVVVTLKRDS
ncbi:MAG: endonuclease/exonuclease/phosphatase family protein [Rikenellaceae bacterium]